MKTHCTALAVAVAAGLTARAELIHHYTFDSDASDSGSGAVDLVLGPAGSISNVCFREGGGSLALQSDLATDARPGDVPAGVPPEGNGTHGWDGAASYQNLAFSPDTRTIATWFRANPGESGDVDATLVNLGVTGREGARFTLRLDPDPLDGSLRILRCEIDGTYVRIPSATMAAKIPGLTSLDDGAWHHLAVVVPNADSVIEELVLYIDGVEFAGDAAVEGDLEVGTLGVPVDTADGPLMVGDGNFGAPRDVNGHIDDVRIYDEALSAADIGNLIAATGSPSTLCDFTASPSGSVAGQTVTLGWWIDPDHDTATLDQGIGDVSAATAPNGNGSITVRPVATTTYTLTVTRGGEMQSLPVTVTVDPDPALGVGVAPAFSDGTVPVAVCWEAPRVLDPRASGTTDSPGGITGAGLSITDSAADFTGDLTAVAGGDFIFELETPVFLDRRARVASFTGTQLTLESPVATTLNPDLAVVPTNSVGDLERCYEAYNTAAQAVANDDTRWAVCDQPGFLGQIGAATFEEPGTNTARFATPVAVSDAKVPEIDLAYEFSATLGNARVWYGANTPHQRNSTGDATFEFWFQPSGLTNGEQIVCEWGGADDGSYLALIDDTLTFVIDGEDGPGGADVITTLSHTLTTTDWIQVVCVYKNTNDATANDAAELWVDGQLVDSVSDVHINDWAGDNAAGIGNLEGTMADGPVTNPVNFEGLIARVALYDPAFTQAQILQNYVALTRDAAAAVPLAEGGAYTVSESLGVHSVTVDDDDPATPSPLFTTDDLDGVVSGCFDAGVVSATTTYTVTATGPLGSTAGTGTVSVGGPGTSFGELVQADAPLAWYRFNEAAGSPTIFDSSGNGHHATIFSGDLTLGATGPIDGALDLGANQVIELPIDFDPQDPDGDDDEFDTDPDGVEGFTIEALVYLDVDEAPDPYAAIASQQDFNGTGRTVLEVVTGSPRLRSFLGGAALETAAGILDDAWTHYAFVCEYNDDFGDYEVSFYEDGVLVETFEGILVESSEGRWQLGTAKALVSEWPGQFDEVAFYLEPLPEATLKAHADAFIAESQIGLLAFGSDAVIGAGGSAELTVKTGGGVAGTIDQGIGSVGPGRDSVVVSPTEATTYTLTVDGEMRTVTVTVLGPIRVVETGIDDLGFFYMTVVNLLPDRTYELTYSADLEAAFTSFGVTAMGGGETPVTFTDTLPASTSPTGFYRLDEVLVAP